MPSALDIERIASSLVRSLWAGIDQRQGNILLDVTIDGARCLVLRLDEAPTISTLSPREQEIARMVADGLTNKSMARVLDISLWTVATHLRRIFAKLGVTSRAAMVARLAPSPMDMPSLGDRAHSVRSFRAD